MLYEVITGFIGMYGHGDGVAIAGQGLVDRVIDNLENHVVQACSVIVV